MKTETPSFTTQNEKKFLSSEEIALEIETVKNKERIAEVEERLRVLALEKKGALKRIEDIENRLAELGNRKAISLAKIRENEEKLRQLEEKENVAKNEDQAATLQDIEKIEEEPNTVMYVAEDGNISEVKVDDVTSAPELQSKTEVKKEIAPAYVAPSRQETDISGIKTELLDDHEPWSVDKGMPQNLPIKKEKNKIFPEDPEAPYIVENIAKYTKDRKKQKNEKSVLQRLSNWIWTNKKTLAIPGTLLGASAALGGELAHQYHHDEMKQEKIRTDERLSIERINNWIQKNDKDTTLYNTLGEAAQIRLASMMLEDYQVAQRSKDTTALSGAELAQREKDPHVVKPETIFEIVTAKMAGGDYTKPVKENSVIGAYGINMRAWGDRIDIPNGDGLWSLKEIHNKRYLQDQYIKAIFENLHGMYGNDTQKIFAGFVNPDTGPQDVGTPAGDVPFDESGMTVNSFVKTAMAEYTKLQAATENGGRFIVDNENQKMYFVNANYQPTYETDIYKVEKGDAYEAYTGMVSGPNTYYKVEQIQGFLHKISKTVDYADYVATHKKLVSSEEEHPGKVFANYNTQRMTTLENDPGTDSHLNNHKKAVKTSRIVRKNKVNS